MLLTVLGDMGYGDLSDDTIRELTSLVSDGKIDAVVHSGDESYADGYMFHWDVRALVWCHLARSWKWWMVVMHSR